MLSDLLS